MLGLGRFVWNGQAQGEAFREHSDHRETVRIADRQCPSDRAFHHSSAGVTDLFLAGGQVRGRFLLLLRRGNSLAGSGPIRTGHSPCRVAGRRTRGHAGQRMKMLVDMKLSPRWAGTLVDALTQAGCRRLFEDRISDSSAKRPGLAQALGRVTVVCPQFPPPPGFPAVSLG